MRNPNLPPSEGGGRSDNEYCLVEVLEAYLEYGDEAGWAAEIIARKTGGAHPQSNASYIRCDQCETSFTLNKEKASIEIWPPGCELGNTLE